MNRICRWLAVLQLLILTFAALAPVPAAAHGEKSQQPALRMRTVHWFDVELSTRKLNVNQTLVVRGSFIPSLAWPEHVASIERTAYLNVGVPGPSFVRLDSRVNGVPGIRSTSFKLGQQYDFEITLKARTPGRYHLHPVINVLETGPVIGPGIWVEVGGEAAAFENGVTTLLGERVDLETYGFANAAVWSAVWVLLGLVWFAYWLTKVPLILPRFRRASALGENADDMITTRDRQAATVILAATLMLIAGGFFYATERWPVTTPLQTGKIKTPPLKREASPVSVSMDDARYRIPGRSFRMELTVTNRGRTSLAIGEFASGGLRFINSAVLQVAPKDPDDLVAKDALRVEGGRVAPGETRKLVIYADDAMWETQRMTTMIASPDAVVAGMLFFFDEGGARYPVEISGPMIPLFGG